MATIIVKCALPDGTIRRVSVARDVTVAALKAQARVLFDPAVDDVDVKYTDSEGDSITIVQDGELVDYVAQCEKDNKAPRFFLFPRASASVAASATAAAVPGPVSNEAQSQQQPQQQEQQQQQPEEPEPEEAEEPVDPITLLARALSKPATVQTVLAQVASSPVVTDSVVQVASAFLDQGPLGAFQAAHEAKEAVKAVAVEAADQDPELKEAVKAWMEAHEGGEGEGEGWFGMGMGMGGRPWGPWGGRGGHGHGHFGRGRGHCHRGGPGFWRRHGHGHCHPHPEATSSPAEAQHPAQQQQQQQEGVHAFVVCDGCSSSPELQNASKLMGKISTRGRMVGQRFKSRTIHDFDLCESCFKSGRFTQTHAPFDLIPPRASAPQQQQQPQCHRNPWAAAAAAGGWPPRPAPPQAQMPMPGGGWCRPGGGVGFGPRGCRGSGRNAFGEVMADTIARCAAAVAEASDETSEMAQIARAISESLRSSTASAAATTTSSGVQKKPAQPEEAAQAKTAASAPLRPQDVVVEPVPAPTPTPASAPAPTPTPASPASDSDEWVVEEAVDPMIKWRDALQRLHALGFTESELYVQFLEEENGDLERVVNRIVRRNA